MFYLYEQGEYDDDGDDTDDNHDHLVVAVDVLLPQVGVLLLKLLQFVGHPVLIRIKIMTMVMK